MKRALGITACMFAMVVLAAAQPHGVPASALSFGTGPASSNHFGPPASAMSLGSGPASSNHFGVPASAMSLGPNGYGHAPGGGHPGPAPGSGHAGSFVSAPGAMQSHFSFRPEHDRDRDRDHDRRVGNGVYVAPVYIPSYYAPYYGYDNGTYVDPQASSQTASDNSGSAYDSGYQAGARAERDRVDAYQQGREDAQREMQSSVSVVSGASGANPTASNAAASAPRDPQDQGPATILIFKNGQQRETHNYAIIGQVLIDIGPHGAHRIPLADLDLPATIKANEEVGNDFKLPRS